LPTQTSPGARCEVLLHNPVKPRLKVVVGLVEILDHIVDFVIEPGCAHDILAKSNLLSELGEVAHLPVLTGVNLIAVATGTVLEMQVFAIVDIDGQRRTRQYS
jgi:hypothetical protein